MQERHSDRERYFDEQARTSERHYIPYIRMLFPELPQEVLEVGCGEGGNLFPFARSGCSVTGVDVAAGRVAEARRFFAERGAEGTFVASDIFELTGLEHEFPLILAHDVIEHVGDKAGFLKRLERFLAPGGVVFMAFPAWQMPFGGHQQIARSRVVSRFPFLHLLPSPLYKGVLAAAGEDELTVRELLSIKRTRCTVEKFEAALRAAGYRVADRRLYFVNPHYETKFGLKPRRLHGSLSVLPYVRDFFSTSCFYLVRPGRE